MSLARRRRLPVALVVGLLLLCGVVLFDVLRTRWRTPPASRERTARTTDVLAGQAVSSSFPSASHSVSEPS